MFLDLERVRELEDDNGFVPHEDLQVNHSNKSALAYQGN